MTEEEAAMAYADGELDPLAAKRFERRMAAEPALAEAVAAHRALRDRLSAAFAPVAEEPLPDTLAAPLRAAPVPLKPARQWWIPGAIAASLALGLMLGQLGPSGPVRAAGGKLLASGGLGTALDRQLSADQGAVRVLVSFRDQGGSYCRVFRSEPVDGIACREPAGWVLRQTIDGGLGPGTAYRQAGSGDAALLAAAQDMMAGEPLDRAGEERARGAGWKGR